jgi:hypothetical protein
VPHTVVAKGTNVVSLSVSVHFVALFLFVAGLLTGTTSLKWTLLPAYASLGGWYESLHIIATALGLLAVFAWILPAQRRHTRLFSLAYFFGNYFLTVVVKPVPWYLPTVAVFGYLTLASLFDQTLDWTARLRERNSSRPWLCHLPRLVWAVGIVIAMGQFAITVCVARQMQVQQAVIENGLRREIGLWLRDHAETPGDTVTLEPLGYIGYFSGLKMLDFPGLASKEVVEARRRLGPGRDNLVHLDLKPDWLVLRPAEIEGESYIQIHLLRRLYELVQVFDATDKVRNTAWLPGRPYLEFDQKFFVFHRKADASADSQLGKD